MSRLGLSRSSTPSPRITSRSAPRTSASSGSRSSGLRTRSACRAEPRWRSETTTVRTGLGWQPMPPLEGILVADFSRVLAGPFATMLLGDLGADVVKVERPEGGDDTRAWGPPWHGGTSTYYLTINRNKRSVALDLADEGDRELARALALRADVLVESF